MHSAAAAGGQLPLRNSSAFGGEGGILNWSNKFLKTDSPETEIHSRGGIRQQI